MRNARGSAARSPVIDRDFETTGALRFLSDVETAVGEPPYQLFDMDDPGRAVGEALFFESLQPSIESFLSHAFGQLPRLELLAAFGGDGHL